jgi:hypothetical protein
MHFACRYMNSVGRVIYILCSPCNRFNEVSDVILSVFSTGDVALLDIPCGSGALTASLVSLLIELRRSLVLPSLPLSITIYGGDISAPSREIFESLLNGLQPVASEVGITIAFRTMHWDATNDVDTAALIEQWFSSSGSASDHVLGILNFSGDLHKPENFERFEPCIRQVIGRLLYDRQGALLWIEPATNEATKGLTSKLKKMISRVPYLDELFGLTDETRTRSASFNAKHPFSQETVKTQVYLPLFRSYVPRER